MSSEFHTADVQKQKKLSKSKGLAKKRKKVIIFLVILLIAGGAVGFFALRGGEGVPMYETGQVLKENLEYHVKVSGRTFASSEQHVLSKAAGTAGQLLVKQGDQIKAGQSLVIIDSPDLDEQLAEAKVRVDMELTRLEQTKTSLTDSQSSLTALESSYNLAKQTYETNQVLYREGALSKSQLDASRLDFEKAESSYSQAKRDVNGGSQSQNVNLQSESLALARLAYSALLEKKKDLTVTSTIDGTVGEITVKAGQSVTAGMELFYIIDNEQVEAIADVGEYDAQMIKTGAPVTLTSDGSNGEPYETVIAYISPYAQKKTIGQGTQTVVEVKAIVPGSVIRSGYSVNFDVLCDKKENVLTIPYEAILTAKDGAQYVFKASEAGKPTAYPITIGLEGALRAELTSGDVKEGDAIILNPTEDMLQTGSDEGMK